jgi:ribose/xylose/arabinose/galactoside ABC-type transport system permease subunit
MSKQKKQATGLAGFVDRIQTQIILNPQFAFTIVVAALVYGYFAFTEDNYFSFRNTFAIMEGFVVLGLVTLGLTVTIIAGEIDLSIGSMAALTGVIVVQLNDPLGAIPALIIGVGIAGLLGAIQGFIVQWLRISAIVFTIGTLMFLRGVSLLVAGEQTVVLRNFEFGDFLKTQWWIFSPASIIAITVFVVIGLVLKYHKFGREIYAIGGARKEALAAGISLTRPLVLAFLISGFCAGLAGAIVGLRSGSAQPLGLQALLLTGTTAAFAGGVSISGGKGSAIGAALGTFLIGFLVSGLTFRATPAYIRGIVLGILLLIVIFVELAAAAFDRYQTRKALLAATDERAETLRSLRLNQSAET